MSVVPTRSLTTHESAPRRRSGRTPGAAAPAGTPDVQPTGARSATDPATSNLPGTTCEAARRPPRDPATSNSPGEVVAPRPPPDPTTSNRHATALPSTTPARDPAARSAHRGPTTWNRTTWARAHPTPVATAVRRERVPTDPAKYSRLTAAAAQTAAVPDDRLASVRTGPTTCSTRRSSPGRPAPIAAQRGPPTTAYREYRIVPAPPVAALGWTDRRQKTGPDDAADQWMSMPHLHLGVDVRSRDRPRIRRWVSRPPARDGTDDEEMAGPSASGRCPESDSPGSSRQHRAQRQSSQPQRAQRQSSQLQRAQQQSSQPQRAHQQSSHRPAGRGANPLHPTRIHLDRGRRRQCHPRCHSGTP